MISPRLKSNFLGHKDEPDYKYFDAILPRNAPSVVFLALKLLRPPRVQNLGNNIPCPPFVELYCRDASTSYTVPRLTLQYLCNSAVTNTFQEAFLDTKIETNGPHFPPY